MIDVALAEYELRIRVFRWVWKKHPLAAFALIHGRQYLRQASQKLAGTQKVVVPVSDDSSPQYAAVAYKTPRNERELLATPGLFDEWRSCAAAGAVFTMIFLAICWGIPTRSSTRFGNVLTMAPNWCSLDRAYLCAWSPRGKMGPRSLDSRGAQKFQLETRRANRTNSLGIVLWEMEVRERRMCPISSAGKDAQNMPAISNQSSYADPQVSSNVEEDIKHTAFSETNQTSQDDQDRQNLSIHLLIPILVPVLIYSCSRRASLDDLDEEGAMKNWLALHDDDSINIFSFKCGRLTRKQHRNPLNTRRSENVPIRLALAPRVNVVEAHHSPKALTMPLP